MLRSTNTGITSIIGPHGNVVDQLPRFETGVLKGEVVPMQGATPFVRWGNGLAVILSCLVLAGFAIRARRGQAYHRE
jgi:apolipoprotein N-acyltransferase